MARQLSQSRWIGRVQDARAVADVPRMAALSQHISAAGQLNIAAGTAPRRESAAPLGGGGMLRLAESATEEPTLPVEHLADFTRASMLR